MVRGLTFTQFHTRVWTELHATDKTHHQLDLVAVSMDTTSLNPFVGNRCRTSHVMTSTLPLDTSCRCTYRADEPEACELEVDVLSTAALVRLAVNVDLHARRI